MIIQVITQLIQVVSFSQITHEAIAIKECCVQLSSRNKQRWKEEIEMMTNRQHPNLISVREIPPGLEQAINSPEPCLGMELGEGGDLRKVLCLLIGQLIRMSLIVASLWLIHIGCLNLLHQAIAQPREKLPKFLIFMHLPHFDLPRPFPLKCLTLGYAANKGLSKSALFLPFSFTKCKTMSFFHLQFLNQPVHCTGLSEFNVLNILRDVGKYRFKAFKL